MSIKINSILKNEKGSGLVLSLMVLLVLSVLGSYLGIVTIGSFKLADNTQDSSSAYYIAEAGANLAYEEIKQDVLDIYEDHKSNSATIYFDNEINLKFKIGTENNYKDYKQQFNDEGIAEVRIEELNNAGNTRDYILYSTGKIDGRARTVEKEFSLEWFEKKETEGPDIPLPGNRVAITVKETLTAENSPLIEGDINKDRDAVISDKFNLEKNIVNLIEDWGVYETNVVIPNIPDKGNITELDDFKGFNKSGLTYLDTSSFAVNLELKGNVKIDTRGNDVMLVVSHLNINKSAGIEVVGDGNLTLYYTGSNELFINENFEFNGNLVSENSGITINSSEGMVKGNVFSKGPLTINNGYRIEGDLVSHGSMTLSNTKINGSVYSCKDINFQNDKTIFKGKVFSKGDIRFDNAEVQGVLFSEKNIIFDNQNEVNALMLAPFGKLHLTNDNYILYGAIIAKHVQFKSGNTISYTEDFKQYLPNNGQGNAVIGLEELLNSISPAVEVD